MTPRGAAVSTTPPKCRVCGKTIPVPQGWTVGPATRRHYWAEHREIMQPNLGGRS